MIQLPINTPSHYNNKPSQGTNTNQNGAFEAEFSSKYNALDAAKNFDKKNSPPPLALKKKPLQPPSQILVRPPHEAIIKKSTPMAHKTESVRMEVRGPQRKDILAPRSELYNQKQTQPKDVLDADPYAIEKEEKTDDSENTQNDSALGLIDVLVTTLPVETLDVYGNPLLGDRSALLVEAEALAPSMIDETIVPRLISQEVAEMTGLPLSQAKQEAQTVNGIPYSELSEVFQSTAHEPNSGLTQIDPRMNLSVLEGEGVTHVHIDAESQLALGLAAQRNIKEPSLDRSLILEAVNTQSGDELFTSSPTDILQITETPLQAQVKGLEAKSRLVDVRESQAAQQAPEESTLTVSANALKAMHTNTLQSTPITQGALHIEAMEPTLKELQEQKNESEEPPVSMNDLDAVGAQEKMSAPERLKAETARATHSVIDLKELLGHASKVRRNEPQEMTLQLSPEHLGKVTVKLVQQDQTLSVEFITDNPAAQQALESSLPQLKEALSRELSFEQLNVNVNQEQPSQGQSAPWMAQSEKNNRGTSTDSGLPEVKKENITPSNNSGLSLYA